MGNEQASRVVLAPGIETNQDELARPPMMRYSIGDEDAELFSEHRTPGGAVRNVVTEAPRSASFQILSPKQAEVFRTPEECHSATGRRPPGSVIRSPEGRRRSLPAQYHKVT